MKRYSDNPDFDEVDGAIRVKNLAAWDARPGPRVGDWVLMADGTERRFTHEWNDGLQTTSKGQPGDASFYFGEGYMSFSGSLDPTVAFERIEPTGDVRDGNAWFFHHNRSQAHNGVYFKVPCRVFREVGK